MVAPFWGEQQATAAVVAVACIFFGVAFLHGTSLGLSYGEILGNHR
jgi:hypothetical protein